MDSSSSSSSLSVESSASSINERQHSSTKSRSSNNTTSSSPAPARDAKKQMMGTVHLFGGVFVGTVAEEMCRNWMAIVSTSTSGGIDMAATATAITGVRVDMIDNSSSSSSSDKASSSPSSSSSPPPSSSSSPPSASRLWRGDDDFPSKGKRAGCGEGEQAPGTEGDGGRGDGTKRGMKRKRAETGLRRPTTDATTAPHHAASAKEGRAEARAKATAEQQSHTSFVSECSLPTDRGLFRMRAYRYNSGGGGKSHEPIAMVSGDVRDLENVPVRVHDQCQTSEVFGSKRCDCKEQLDMSLRYVQQKGGGAVIYLAQEGRGIGLANKVAAYALQDGGLDTVDANRQLGFKDDERSYECVAFILRDMGIKSIQLMTNNPFKIDRLKASGVKVEGRIPIQVPPNEHNHGYLEAKANRMSHLINNL